MFTQSQFDAVHELLREVGRFQVEEQARVAREEGERESEVVQSKGADGPFTYVDKKSEEMLAEGLEKIQPAEFRGEETTEWTPWKGLCWIVDPLDGTVSYLWRKWHWSISVALFNGNEPVACFVYNPLRDTLYALFEGKALRNGQKVSVVPGNRLICGSRGAKKVLYDQYVWDGNGSAALACAMIAAGEVGAYACTTNSEGMRVWDVAAGLPILLAAGGVLKLMNKDSYAFNQEHSTFPDFVAGHEPFVDELVDRLRK